MIIEARQSYYGIYVAIHRTHKTVAKLSKTSIVQVEDGGRY
jgi:hypothetical protein